MAEMAGENVPAPRNKSQLTTEREDDQSSFSSDETQTGVKNIEAVSRT